MTAAAGLLQWWSLGGADTATIGKELTAERTEGTTEATAASLTRGEMGATARNPIPRQPPPDLAELASEPQARVSETAVVYEPTNTVEAAGVATPIPAQLSRDAMLDVLRAAGWPEALFEEALAVSWCESKWSPGAVGDGGNSLGLFQLNRMWFGYAGEDAALWADPLVNARTAYAVYQYDSGRGYPAWKQWTCKPF